MRDDAETAKLERFGQELQWLEDRLPIDPSYRRKKLGGLAPMRVVNVVFGAGDGNHDVQTAAFNLPNDERIVAEMGSKRTMLKNYQQAKFDKTLLPISKVALAAGGPAVRQLRGVLHAHPDARGHARPRADQHRARAARGGGVRQAIKELYSTVEEAKADISGLWALQKLMDKGVLDRERRTARCTRLSSRRRSARCASASTSRTPRAWRCR